MSSDSAVMSLTSAAMIGSPVVESVTLPPTFDFGVGGFSDEWPWPRLMMFRAVLYLP